MLRRRSHIPQVIGESTLACPARLPGVQGLHSRCTQEGNPSGGAGNLKVQLVLPGGLAPTCPRVAACARNGSLTEGDSLQCQGSSAAVEICRGIRATLGLHKPEPVTRTSRSREQLAAGQGRRKVWNAPLSQAVRLPRFVGRHRFDPLRPRPPPHMYLQVHLRHSPCQLFSVLRPATRDHHAKARESPQTFDP